MSRFLTLAALFLTAHPSPAQPPTPLDRAKEALTDAAAEAKAKAGQAADAARQKGAEIAARANLKRVASAIFAHHDQLMAYPPAAVTDPSGKPLLSWRVTILPHVGEAALYAKFKKDEPWDGPTNKSLIAQMPKVYADPRPHAAGAGEGKTYIKLFVGPELLLHGGAKKSLPRDVPDGTSNTMLAAVGGDPVVWSKPDDIEIDLNKPLPDLTAPFPNLLLLFADTATYSVPSGVWREKPEVIKKALTPAGGEVWTREELHPNAR